MSMLWSIMLWLASCVWSFPERGIAWAKCRLMFDHASASAWFDYMPIRKPARGTRSGWVDTPSSMSIKYVDV